MRDPELMRAAHRPGDRRGGDVHGLGRPELRAGAGRHAVPGLLGGRVRPGLPGAVGRRVSRRHRQHPARPRRRPSGSLGGSAGSAAPSGAPGTAPHRDRRVRHRVHDDRRPGARQRGLHDRLRQPGRQRPAQRRHPGREQRGPRGQPDVPGPPCTRSRSVRCRPAPTPFFCTVHPNMTGTLTAQ